MASPEYYLRQAEIASRMALAESNPEKARALHVLALDYFDRAEKARAETAMPAYQLTPPITNQELEK
ncbi:hypothetical protein QCM80_18195 [Bradyrhizobium sp. SSUT112]|uniref:hypothetical protein n=1 Tax=Bradyrhizobium sp. SSUT112 TaxID=3040604 RepID=UPI00244C54A7|nr:hypothetical protein [Bradyrhizobium sp. SSUT112]MDH2352569.1 hypothetical protein [Bradyrhizobium sp. SSUT112]